MSGNGHQRLVAVGAAALALAGCGGSGGNEALPEWSATPKPDAAGHVPVAAYNDFLAGDGKVFARSPIAATTEFLRLDRASSLQNTVQATSPGEVRNFSEVVATLTGLQDDSVRDARYTLELQKDKTSGDWRLRAVDYAQKCQPGRGHQDFSPKLCV
jgi:hypothetical protein